MASDEKGYVQFRSDWQLGEPPAAPVVADLIRWRDRLFHLGLIGVYPDGIGYGNLSIRLSDGSFLITGTATGGLPHLEHHHICTVTAFDIPGNHVTCRGPVQASSESLSHAAIYQERGEVRAVIHVHHAELWNRSYGDAPTTDPAAEAGTPAMGEAIAALLRAGVPEGFFVMGGHREGVMTFGETIEQAGERILAMLNRYGCAGSCA